MMSMAAFVWFPNIIREIHFVTRGCPACTSTGKNLSTPCSQTNSAPRASVSRPLEELELDFWGPLSNNPSSQLYVPVFLAFPLPSAPPVPP